MVFCGNLSQQYIKLLVLTMLILIWVLDETSFEKMGELMAANNGKMIGIYDELISFLAQINIF